MSESTPWRDEENLRKLYKERGMTDSEIGEELGCSRNCIGKWRRKFGIESDHAVDDRLDNQDNLKRLYKKEGLTTYEIADKFGCCEHTVRQRLIKFNIDRRSASSDYAHDLLSDSDELERLYVDERLSTIEIAERADTTPSAVRYWMRQHGIDSRTISEANTAFSDSDLGKIESLYWEDGYSSREIADVFDTYSPTICRVMRRAGVERRDSAPTGPEHPRWNGGSPPYGPGWNNSKKRAVRERDDHNCQDPGCSVTQSEHLDEYDEKLHVHHLRKARDVDDPELRNAKENLITLCRDCHQKWEKIADAGLVPEVER